MKPKEVLELIQTKGPDALSLERALHVQICALLKGKHCKHWLKEIVIQLPGLLHHKSFVKPLLHGIPWFIKTEIVLKKFHLFEQFCLALVSLETESLPKLVNFFFSKLLEYAQSPPLPSLRDFNINGIPFSSTDSILQRIHAIISKYLHSQLNSHQENKSKILVDDEQDLCFLRSVLSNHPNPEKVSLLESKLTKILIGESEQGSTCFFLQPVVGPLRFEEISFIKSLWQLNDTFYRNSLDIFKQEYDLYASRFARILNKLALQIPGAKQVLFSSGKAHFPKIKYPLPMQIMYVKVLLGVAQNVEELEQPLIKLIVQHMAFLDSQGDIPARFSKEKAIQLREYSKLKDQEKVLDNLMSVLCEYCVT